MKIKPFLSGVGGVKHGKHGVCRSREYISDFFLKYIQTCSDLIFIAIKNGKKCLKNA